MSVSFLRPWLLPLLALVVWVAWCARRSYGGLGRARKCVAVALRSLVVALVVFALAGMGWKKVAKEVVVFFVIDRSKSMPRTLQAKAFDERLRDYVSRALAAKSPGDLAGVVVFGGDASVEFSPVEELPLGQFYSIVDRDYTDVSNAVRLACAAFPQSARKRAVVISDFNENSGDAAREARRARASGVSIDALPVDLRLGREILVEKVVCPSEVAREEAFDVRAVLAANASAPARVKLYVDGCSSDALERELVLEAGKSVVRFRMELDSPGLHVFEARLTPLNAADDSVEANNVATDFTLVRGEARVVIVCDAVDEAAPLAAALAGEKIEVVVQPHCAVPGSFEELYSYDCVILANVPASGFLDKEHMKALQSAVRDGGTGLIVTGGASSFGAGGYLNTPVEEVLPIDMDIKEKEFMPKGALALILHTCEMPNGNYWAKRISKAAIGTLSDFDLVGVLLFDWQRGAGARWLFKLQPVAGRERMYALINGAAPGDMPDFGPTLQMAYAALSKCSAALKHIIIISDGDPARPSGALVKKIRAAKITVSTVGLAPHGPGGASYLKVLAKQTGGNFYLPRNPSTLPQIFTKEAARVRSALIQTRPFLPRMQYLTPPLKGFSPGEFPQLNAFVMTTAKPRARVPLLATVKERGKEELSPLLAHWMPGLGRSVAFTSGVGSKWAPAWVSWERYRAFWTQLVRWTMRKRSRSPLAVECRIRGKEGRVVVEAVDEEGRFLDLLELKGSIRAPAPEFRSSPLRFEQTAPGRYEAAFAAFEHGTYIASVVHRDPGGTLGVTVAGASVPYSPELVVSATDNALAREVAQAGGGRLLDWDAPEKAFTHDLPETVSFRESWKELLALALLLFVLDVAVRRVSIDWAAVARFLRRKKEILREETVDRLLKAKHKVEERPKLKVAVPRAPLRTAPARPGAAPAPPKKEAKQKEAKKEEDTYTSRLLEAKRRALKRRKEEGGD